MTLATGIAGRIDRMIRSDLRSVLLKYKGTDYEDVIWKYRDKNFLGGQYDYIFYDFVKTYKDGRHSNTSPALRRGGNGC